MTSREILRETIGPDEGLKGKVGIPVEFEKISMLAGISADEALGGVIGKIKEDHKVIPQYRSAGEKLGGGLFGFYINHSVDQQNNINENMATVCAEFDRLTREKTELLRRINELSAELLAMESGK